MALRSNMQNTSTIPSTHRQHAMAMTDVERRIFDQLDTSEIPALRAARRRFLETNELMESAEAAGNHVIKRRLLLARLRALKLPSSIVNESNIVAVDVSNPANPDTTEIINTIEHKLANIKKIPRYTGSTPQPGKSETVDALQCRLIARHSEHLGELISEASLLIDILRFHNDSNTSIYHTANALERYFGGLIFSLSLKLKITELSMHRELYSKETVKAIEELKHILDSELASLNKENKDLDQRLAIYSDAGDEFREIAESYADLLRETEQVKLDIVRLSQL